ncbi:MAG TPA: tripartite tricarboxylate transporter substrate-binding protein [Variovorax sp.]|nr:tripartite tricarboxylate transporter substrate-binding protein [Variovorax sp.]
MTKNKRTLLLSALAAAAGALLAPVGALAQDAWPTKPLRIVVGFPGGSTPDIAARTIGEPLAKALGQPVVIDNKPGASGNIAADLVAKANDDHTLGVVINGNLTSSKMLYPKLPYDPAKDFTYLSLLTTAPLILVTPTSEPSGAAFLEAARKGGDKWNYGSVGVGSVGHLGMELLESRVPGMLAQHVPYQGNPQVVTAMLGGQVQMALIPPGVAMPQVKAGKLKAIGLTGGRSTLVPEIPPLAEIGVKDFNLEVWTALLGPANLSKAAQARIARELAIIMKDPDVRRRLFEQGWQAVGTSPEGMRLRVKDEAAIMSKIISTKGIKLQ